MSQPVPRRTARAPVIAGAFAPLRVLAERSQASRREMLASLGSIGLSHLLTEGIDVPIGLVEEAAAAGLRLGTGLACFSDHAGSIRPIPESLRPVGPDGLLRPQMEWYRGVIPTDRSYADDLTGACRRLASTPSVDVLVLDFIRWPLHWELELRAGSAVLDSSFDPITLRRFREEMDVDVPDGASAAAQHIQRALEGEWAAFKCQVITDLVARIAAAVRNVRSDLPLGAYVVPGTDEQRRRFAGQDVAAMAEHLDLLLPMTYHAILREPATWVGGVVADLRGRVAIPVLPVVQATADAKVAAGSDWGAGFPPAVLGEAVDAGLDAGAAGFVAFPAQGLDPSRLAVLKPRVARARAQV